MVVTKSNLIQTVAVKTQVPATTVGTLVSSLLEIIQDALSQGQTVQIVGFGHFGVRARPERIARNPLTGEPMRVPATRIPYFRPGKTLRLAVAADPGKEMTE